MCELEERCRERSEEVGRVREELRVERTERKKERETHSQVRDSVCVCTFTLKCCSVVFQSYRRSLYHCLFLSINLFGLSLGLLFCLSVCLFSSLSDGLSV